MMGSSAIVAKKFSLKKSEAHAGSTNQRPSANIFFEDGRSLLECQMQLKRENCKKSFVIEPNVKKGKWDQGTNDYICSVCYSGGELILCDQCPSSFHANCLGLKDVPDGDWFCPPYCCGICGQSRFNRDTEKFLDNSVLNCDQCEHQYHVGCLRKRGLIKLERYPKGNWFCNRTCEQIFLGLCKLLGKPVPVGEDDFTWSLLKCTKCDGDHDASDDEAFTESYSKLNVALCVMHECFEPIKESHTRRDLVEDIIFSRWSELNRLNCRGFYTIILERNDELITVATDLPLIGTRFRYCRLGMCQILMNELERYCWRQWQ
ncbi:increased DNA methylation 1-like isoform X2 [Cornus florida]|uniref:increased DNA methylation 1-like isoform X2 n=1 Tax=Cornus florida TaxID=4283 RepID=UPI00289F813E|nr:increased DNA methylation 1-like isoform X2 [Cornus florida]